MNPATSMLLTDLYQLTMIQGYLQKGLHDTAVFEFSIRTLPEKRGFFVAAGLEYVLDFLEGLRLSPEETDYLSRCGRFSRKLIDYLSHFRFSGHVDAMPEGTVCYPNEPLIRVTAPLPEAQLIESRLINIIHFQSLIATKAARCHLAARGRAILVDFGLRRAHGAEAGLFAARSSYIAGFEGTATVMAEPLYDIPIFGTMAHSFIEAQSGELEAFLSFAEANPGNVTLLIDTYDTLKGARTTVQAATILKERGISVNAVRIDSGDLAGSSRRVRALLDEAGYPSIKIFVSGNIDEYGIRDLLDGGAPIDGFGVGTKMDTSDDAPYFDCAYKLMEYAGVPRMKISTGKLTLPGAKQVFRLFENNRMVKDVLTVEGDDREGTPLLRRFMEQGKTCEEHPRIDHIREYTLGQLETLPRHFLTLETRPAYPVEISEKLAALTEAVERTL